MFEPAMQGPKPSVPSKPGPKPPPPKRSDDTKLEQNGEVPTPLKNNVIPKKIIADFINKKRDENSNVKGGNLTNGTDIQLNQTSVSKFNSITSDKPSSKPPWVKSEDKPNPTPPWVKSGEKPSSTPPWVKSEEKSSSSPPWVKPKEVSPKPTGKLPIEGLANRVKMFEQKPEDEKDMKCDKSEKSQPLVPAVHSGIAEKKEALSGIFQPKLPSQFKMENKPPATLVKPETKHPPPTPTKPSTTDQEGTISPLKSKHPAGSLPVSPGGGPQDELMRAIQKRKESIRQKSEIGQNDEKPQLRNTNRTRTKSVKRKSLTRLTDNKKFYLVEMSDSGISNVPPPKPSKIFDIDLDKIISEHKKKFSTQNDERPVSQGVVEEDEELYEVLPGEDDFPPPPPPIDVSRPVSERAVSMIEPLTEEDEVGVDDVYDEGFSAPAEEPPPIIPGRPPRRGNLPELPPVPTEEDPSVDQPKSAETSDIKEEDENSDGELYEPLDDIVNEVTRMEEEKNSVNDNKTEQLSEKERKKREKEEKKRLEEEKKRHEKRLKEIKSKFKIEPGELEPENSKGSGVIKEDAKGRGKDLTVKKDQRVNIICMDKRNPKGKWLVKLEENDEILGYVDSNNVEVDNTLIRSVMTASGKKNTSFNDLQDDQEEYEAIEPEQDEVYTEAM